MRTIAACFAMYPANQNGFEVIIINLRSDTGHFYKVLLSRGNNACEIVSRRRSMIILIFLV